MKAIMRDEREMKDSGIEWIGDIPKGWNTIKLKYCTDCLDGRRIPVDSNERISGLYPYWGAGKIMDYVNDYIFDEPLILLGEDGAPFFDDTRPVCHRVAGKIWVNNHIHVLKEKDNMLGTYIVHSLNSVDYHEYINGSILNKLTQSNMNKISIPNPSFDEQEAIANYLDDRCSKIDAIIAEAKASIEEYKELKQAVITQAVTLGIKKNRPLKDTNILWIGKTPCDWQLAELKFFASIKSGITLGQKYPAGAKLVEMPYLRVANVQGEYVDLSDVKTIQVLPEEVDKYRLEAGVVLMTEGGDRDKLGRGCVWHGEITPCLHQNHIFALTTKSDKLLPEYFSHVTTSEVARCYFDYTAKKTTNLANTNSSTIMNFRLPIPPLEEQREIVQYLDKRIKTLNDMISEKQSLIEDLEAYKKSLIYEVVTGKRKVVA